MAIYDKLSNKLGSKLVTNFERNKYYVGSDELIEPSVETLLDGTETLMDDTEELQDGQ